MTHILTLTPVQDSDLDILEKWLRKDYILKWYHDADEWLHEIKERNNTFSFLKHYMVSIDNTPIGFCQYYDCFDAQEEWYSMEAPNKIYSIDYLIGEEAYLQKGYGKAIVKALVNEINKYRGVEAIIVQPDKENMPSNKALLANDFVYDDEKEYYILKY